MLETDDTGASVGPRASTPKFITTPKTLGRRFLHWGKANPRSRETTLEYLGSQTVAEVFNEFAEFANQTAQSIYPAVKQESNVVLWTVLIDVCAIRGLLLELKQFSQDDRSQIQWKSTMDTLYQKGGPLKTFKENLKMLESKYALRSSPGSFDIARIRTDIETQKRAFAIALQNNSSVLSEFLNPEYKAPLSNRRLSDLERRTDDRVKNARISQWLSGPGASSEHSEALRIPKPETQNWFIKSKEFGEWMRDKHAILWLYGIAGSGLTRSCASVIEYLQQNAEETDSLAYFSFSSTQGNPGDVANCLRSLIAQLLKELNVIPATVEEELTRPSINAQLLDKFRLVEVLLFIIQSQQRTFIVMDAIDEGSVRADMMEILSIINAKKVDKLHLLISGQWSRENKESFKEDNIIAMNLRDIGSVDRSRFHIQEWIHGSPKFETWDDALTRDIEASISERAEKGSHWVDCCLDIFGRCRTSAEAKSILDHMPLSIDDCYDLMLSKIPEEFTTEARNVFQWLAFAKRPLSLEEVAKAVALECHIIDEICWGLIIIAPSTELGTGRERIGFSYPTVRKHLVSTLAESPKGTKFLISELESQQLITHVSLSYLFSSTKPNSTPDGGLDSFALLDYAAEYWLEHVNAVRTKGNLPQETIDLAIALFETKYNESVLKGIDTSSVSKPEGPEAVRHDFPRFPPPLYYASLLGTVELVSHLIMDSADVNCKGGFCGTPLQAAAYSGYRDIVETLLKSGALVNAKSGFYGTALQASVYRDHKPIMQILLAHGADPNAESGFYGNALQAAAVCGNIDLAQELIEYGANINAKSGKWGNALTAAAQGAHRNVVQILLDNGADINLSRPQDDLNALYAAASSGDSEVVKLLLDRGADLNTKGREYGSTLAMAVSQGDGEVVEMLVRSGAYFTTAIKGSAGQECANELLHLAVQRGHDTVVQLLLQWTPVNANSRDKEGLSPLTIAVLRGNSKIVRLLLEREIDMGSGAVKGNIALNTAVQNDHEQSVRSLLDSEAELSAVIEDLQTERAVTVSSGNISVVQFIQAQHRIKDKKQVRQVLLELKERGGLPKSLEPERREDFNVVLDVPAEEQLNELEKLPEGDALGLEESEVLQKRRLSATASDSGDERSGTGGPIRHESRQRQSPPTRPSSFQIELGHIDETLESRFG